MIKNDSQKKQTATYPTSSDHSASALQKFLEKDEIQHIDHSLHAISTKDGRAPSVFRCFRTDWICKTPRQCQNAPRDRYRFLLIVGKRSRWCFAVAKLVPKSRLFFSFLNMISKVAVKNMGLVSSGRRKSGHATRRIAPAANG
ncbi:Histidinol-phosphate aminotransferase [Trichinella pseudospiralis]